MYTVNKVPFSDLYNFREDSSYLSIVQRKTPKEANLFFKHFLPKSFNVTKEVFKKTCFEDIQKILSEIISKDTINNTFYNKWVKDMAEISLFFCDTLNSNSIRFSLGTDRGCKRYHIDNVSMRLLVTYYGKGTEWIPSSVSDYAAYTRGETNEKILLNNNCKKFIKAWNIALFKGKKFNNKKDGILHKTPDVAFNQNTILMRLDDISEF